MHYVVGDVHGCFRELMDLINKINSMDPDAEFIFVGDFVDRGPQVMETVNWFVENVRFKGKYSGIRGNHDQMVLEWYKDFERIYEERRNKLMTKEEEESDWLPESYYNFKDLVKEYDLAKPDKLEPIIKFIKRLPCSKTMEITSVWNVKVRYHIAHAWYIPVNLKDSSNYMRGRNELCMWERESEYEGNTETDNIIVHGHTPTMSENYQLIGNLCNRPGLIGYRKNAVNVDGGCCYFGKTKEPLPCMLCALCLENFEEIYPYSLEERFAMLPFVTDPDDAKYRAEEYRKKYLTQKNFHRNIMLIKLGNTEGNLDG